MPTNPAHNYEFGAFLLNPTDRVLLHFNQLVDLPARDFDILLYLVEHANEFVRTSSLIEAIWGINNTIQTSNVTHHIAKIRKALGSDSEDSKYIKTLYGRHGYRFIAPVSKTAYLVGQHPTSSDDRPREQFEIDSHIFVPVYLGESAFVNMTGSERTTSWVTYKELEIENGRLCVLKSGIGVWHLRGIKRFASLIEAASWRKEFYEKIFQEDRLRGYVEPLLDKNRLSKQGAVFKPIFGKPGYAYSMMILKEPRWNDIKKIRRVLQILSCPKPLETKNESRPERERVNSLERQLLEDGLNSLDIREFGLAGEDLGSASWEGLSLYQNSTGGTQAIDTLIELQIAVHSLWWFSKCLADTWLSDPDFAAANLSKHLPEIKKQLLILKNIEAKESTTQRTMIEALLGVNRVQEMVDETLELYS